MERNTRILRMECGVLTTIAQTLTLTMFPPKLRIEFSDRLCSLDKWYVGICRSNVSAYQCAYLGTTVDFSDRLCSLDKVYIPVKIAHAGRPPADIN